MIVYEYCTVEPREANNEMEIRAYSDGKVIATGKKYIDVFNQIGAAGWRLASKGHSEGVYFFERIKRGREDNGSI